MKFSFLRHLPGLGGPAPRQVVSLAAGSEQPAAALRQLLQELPDLLLAAVLDADSGQLLASYAAERQYQPTLVTAPAVAVVQQIRAGVAATPDEPLQEVLLTLTSQLHLLRLAADGRRLLYLAVDRRDTNLAIARQLAQQAAAQLTAPS